MSTIFDNFNGDVDLSIFRKSNKDPKTPLRRHYLSLVGLLEYVDILNGDLTGRKLPDGITVKTVKGMIVHGISDLDTVKVMMSEDDSRTKYVDLGLPSGTLWATENIKDEEGNELYFDWGGKQGYTAEQVKKDKKFTWGDYVFGDSKEFKKYTEKDGLTELEPEDDAATVNWGQDWRMPTKKQFEELMAYTKQEWTEVNGVKGTKLISIIEGYTDKFVFFPAVGFASYSQVDGVNNYGYYWALDLDTDVKYAWKFNFESAAQGMYKSMRFMGHSVRPVRANRSSHDFVDLLLPSGTLWATCNIGASSPEKTGLYFAWGETQGYTAEQVGKEEGKKLFTFDDYKFGEKGKLTKYNSTDKRTVLDSEDDAATDIWGKEWMMPTEEQFNELKNNTKQEWTKINGVQGVKFISVADKNRFVFFPTAGRASDAEVIHIKDLVEYWTSSVLIKDALNDAYTIAGKVTDNVTISTTGRCYGHPVRPVRVSSSTDKYVDLGLPSGTLWASENIKDEKGNELYFAWGETKGYTKSQITDGVRSFSLQSYEYNENPSTLDAEHDAATINWGSDCKMPTQKHFEELFENTTRVYKDGKLIFKSKINGNSIEFKALGYAQENEVLDEGNFGHYWTSSLGESNNANSLYFSSAIQIVDSDSRIYGRLIRPIKPKPEQPEQHDYVDLGLKSGTLWATENIKDVNGKELYFAWGDTQGYTAEQVGKDKNFNIYDYVFGNPPSKYNETDGKTELDTEDDAATDNWGKEWMMPTKDQFKELTDNTEQEWVEINNVPGIKFTSKVEGYTDKFVFFPAAGRASEGKVDNDDGYYWSVSLTGGDVSMAMKLHFNKETKYELNDQGRSFGQSVRPVRSH